MRKESLFDVKILLLFFTVLKILDAKHYDPNWPSINSRPLPEWYDEAKLGIMVVWGVYSVPSWGNWTEWTYSPDAAWYWHRLVFPDTDDYETYHFHKKTYGLDTTYQDFAHELTGEMWDPDHWADVISKSGAKYMVITSKYHDGFCMWPSEQSWNWNSVDLGPKRDVVGELAKSIRAKGITFGLYHSLYEWFNPLYLADRNSSEPPSTHLYIDQVLMPQLKDMTLKYEPDIIWSDGDWDETSDYWRSTEFLAWLYNESPVRDTVVVNDRWGKDCRGKNGGFYTPYDGYNPGKLLPHKWEDSYTIGTSYGYNRHQTLDIYTSSSDVIRTFVQVVSTGGNMIIGLGPTKDGLIPVILEERLTQLGNWLEINGAAIYSTKPWRVQNDTAECNLWYTAQATTVYALFFDWPSENILTLYSPIPKAGAVVRMLGQSKELRFEYDGSMHIRLPNLSIDLATQSVWALEMINVD